MPSTGLPRAHELAQRVGQPLALDPERHRGRLAAGHHEPVEPLEVARHAHLARLGAELAQQPAVGLEVALQREDADERRDALPAPVGEELLLLELARLQRGHRRAEALGRAGDPLGVLEVGGRLDDRLRRAWRDPRT